MGLEALDLSENIILIILVERQKNAAFYLDITKTFDPVKGKPVILHIMNLFKSEGFNKFYINK